MTPELWAEIELLYGELAGLPPMERQVRLSGIADEELQREVASLLAAGSLNTKVAEAIGDTGAAAAQPALQRFGPWRTTGVIGHGGMGAVYNAVRADHAFDKRVAIKVLHMGVDSPEARQRFRQERGILAGLEHPNIARLLDGGETESGLSYIVLEYVNGESIVEYCESRNLGREERVRLFLQVCAAVHYAHRNLIVHRDLKPANILVTREGVPKLLDFGIAKLMEPGALQTMTGFQALTPQYASPEQIRGQAVTTATDVYSLGMVLYEMLAGRRAYEVDSTSFSEIARTVCESEPDRPGHGDELDHIILMALRKEPDRRYAGADRFAEDIERYLDHRPVSARPDTIRYRAKKFVRRNWWQIAAMAIVILSLSAGLSFSLVAQQRANRRFNQVRQLANRFLFDFHDEIANTPGTVKARGMIVSTALEYLNSLAADTGGDPGLQWEMAVAYGKVAAAQGSPTSPSLRRPRDAMASYEKALAIARPLADGKSLDIPQRVALVNLLCDAELMRRSLREYDAAARLGREAVERSAGLPGHAQRRALNEMATTLFSTDDLTGSVNVRERTIPIVRETVRRDPSFDNRRELASTLVNLGYVQTGLTRFTEATASETEALALYRALAAERPGDARLRRRIFYALVYLGLLEGAGDKPSLERPAEAAARFREALAEMEALIAADPNDKASRHDAGLVHGQIAFTLRDVAPGEAIQHATAAAKLLDDASPDSNEFRAEPRIAGADAYRKLHQFAQAETLLEEAERVLTLRGTDTEAALDLAWARLEAARGNSEAAARYFDQSIALDEKLLAKAATPAHAWALAQALDFAASTISASAPSRRERILAVWTDQNRRLPGQPYIEKQVAEARMRLTR